MQRAGTMGLLCSLAMGLLGVVQAEPLQVASFHPLASDLARQVGGAQVAIIELVEPGQDPHQFTPSPSDMQAIEQAPLILVMGKGLEPYLDTLQENLRSGQTLFEIGRMIPSLRMEDDMQLFTSCPDHAHSSIDPHWWHSVRNMRRATRLVAEALSEAAPQQADLFQERARQYDRQLEALDRWARSELDRIPRSRRRLATAHAAFNYFCAAYRFRAAPILGLSSMEATRPGQVRQVIDALVEEQIPAVFPERSTNPEMLRAIAREAGVSLGRPLMTGPSGENLTFEAMFRHNVRVIVEGLDPQKETL